ncbi:MAG: TIGR02147 family protein [Bacteriovoracaceae bacterium]
MKEQLSVQNLLNRKLVEYKTINTHFSIRSLARRLEMQPSATSEILKGKRKVSFKKAQQIAEKLLLNPSERAELFRHFNPQLKKSKQDLSLLKLNAHQFAVISEWTYYAILSLMETSDFQSKTSWIATRLGLSLSKVEENLKKLEELKLIKVGAQGKMTRTHAKLNTSDDVLEPSIQKSHLSDLEMAKQKLVSIPVKQRDFTSFTLPVDPDLLPKAKEILRKAQDDLDELMRESQCTEVYRVCMYLFPLTQLQSKQEES